jgi:hypothetical protein
MCIEFGLDLRNRMMPVGDKCDQSVDDRHNCAVEVCFVRPPRIVLSEVIFEASAAFYVVPLSSPFVQRPLEARIILGATRCAEPID